MSIVGFQTVPTTPNTRTANNQSVLWNLQYFGPRLPSFIITDLINRGEDVQRVRRYERGEPDQVMSAEVRKVLTVRSDGGLSFLGANYQMPIIQTFVDRCNLQSVEAPGNDAGTAWCNEVYEYTRMDALQGDVHERTICDGDCCVMTWWDNDLQQVRYTIEEAWDGTQGMIPIYRSKSIPVMDCAIKIWQIFLDQSLNILIRINIYYADHVEKYFSINQAPPKPWFGGDISIPQYKNTVVRRAPREPIVRGTGTARNYLAATDISEVYESTVIHFDPEEQTEEYSMPDGSPLGIPVIHFRNRARHNFGVSEIKSTIPIQDLMNRLMYSMAINAEYNAFPLIWSKGFQMPDALRPGTIVAMSEGTPMQQGEIAEMGRIPGSDPKPYLDALNWCSMTMGKISRTPSPEFASEAGRISGEALKQLEIGLIGKANRFMIKCGNAWEDVFMMANRIQTAYGNKKPPKINSFKSIWQSPEIRDDLQTVQGAMLARPVMGDAQTRRTLAPIYNLDQSALEQIEEEIEQDQADKMQAMMSTPMFGQGQSMPATPGQSPNGNGAGGNEQIQPETARGEKDMTEAASGKQEVTAQ
jgi:hypothetical protein